MKLIAASDPLISSLVSKLKKFILVLNHTTAIRNFEIRHFEICSSIVQYRFRFEVTLRFNESNIQHLIFNDLTTS